MTMPALPGFIVTRDAMRPASEAEECFYCNQPLGQEHKADCVLISKKVKVRLVVEYEVSVPASWEKGDVEFHRNDGSWCASNALTELAAIDQERGCLCAMMNFECLEDTSGPFLDERGEE